MFHIYITYHDDYYDLYVFDLSYVIHVYIYLSLDKTELRTQNTEPVLLQMTKGKTVFWHIFFCLKHYGIVMFLRDRWVFTYIVKNISIEIQHTTYGTHIYLICIVYAHISWCHNYPYDILVHIQAGEIVTLWWVYPLYIGNFPPYVNYIYTQ